MVEMMKADFSVLVHPRQYGLQVYTDEDLRIQSQKIVGTNFYRGEDTDPAHVLRVDVVKDGIIAHCRTWREGDRARNPETGSEGTVRRSVLDGALLVLFIEGSRFLGGNIHPVSVQDQVMP